MVVLYLKHNKICTAKVLGINLTVSSKKLKHKIFESKKLFNEKMHMWHKDDKNAKVVWSEKSPSAVITVLNSANHLGICDTISAFELLGLIAWLHNT